jgi:hypothetical protein
LLVVRKGGFAGSANRRTAMTVYDLLFIALFFTAVGTLVVAAISALRGRRRRSFLIFRRLAFCAMTYIAIVYAVTALSRTRVLRVGDPECEDDWCLAVQGVKRTRQNAVARYDVTLRIFSRARRVAQREMGAKDVYLMDARWKRYDPVTTGPEVPLNTLLQAGESVTASRRFELPADVHDLGLLIDRTPILPFCVIIGECGAFHRGTIVRID